MANCTYFLLMFFIFHVSTKNCFTFEEFASANYIDYFPRLQNYSNIEIVQAIENFENNSHSGKGGHGVVKILTLTHRIRGHSQLAVKKITKKKTRSKLIYQAEDEVKQWLRVNNSPYVPSFYGCFEDKQNNDSGEYNTVYIISEPLSFDLYQKEMVNEQFNLKCIKNVLPNLNDRINFYSKIFMAINDINIRNLVHNDIKPSNIMVGPYGYQDRPFLVDFGVSDQPGTSAFVSTPCYEFKNKAQVGYNHVAYDVYSAGVTILDLENSFQLCSAYHRLIDKKTYNASQPSKEYIDAFNNLFDQALQQKQNYLLFKDISECRDLNCVIYFVVQTDIEKIPEAKLVAQILQQIYQDTKRRINSKNFI